ncbi:MAG TPA: guanylate kinase [Terriglobia bacterium]|nr:guanylate kinase [Terriglobia bacterium]
MSSRGQLFIVSAPSGSGKSTIVNQVLNEVPDLIFSVSFTTRSPRGHERDGIEYHFVSENVFQQMINEGQFIEHAKVFDHYYGTARSTVEAASTQGKDVILDIEAEGATQVRRQIADTVSVFIFPPSYSALKNRLEQRGQDQQETILKRLDWAKRAEITRYREYDFVIVNENLSLSVNLLKSIIIAERCRKKRSIERIESIIKTFGGI